MIHRVCHSIVTLLIVVVLAACSLGPGAASQVSTAPSATLAVPPTVAASPTIAVSPMLAPSATATPAPTATFVPSPTLVPLPTPLPLEPTPTLAALSQPEREALFDEVWTLVRDEYLYPDFQGIDWQATRDEFAPQVAAAESPEAFYHLMRLMIDRLADEHSRFESPQDVAAIEASFENQLRYGGIGAMVRTTEEGGVITNVAPDGPADTAGLHPRDLITKVEGINFADPDAFGIEGPISVIRGEPGTPLELTVQSPNEAPREVNLVRQIIPGDAFPKVETERLAGDVGLVRIDTFFLDDLDVVVREKIEALLNDGPVNGLIFDVRTNAGGYVHLMLSTLGLVIDGGSIGTTTGRNFSQDLDIPSGQTIAGLNGVPVVVLTGPTSVSAAEMFAAGIQVTGRGSVVGMATAGNTENLSPYNFEDGSRMLLAVLAYRLPDGTLIEGRGVLPDREVDAEWWDYDTADDPQIKAALEEITARQANGS